MSVSLQDIVLFKVWNMDSFTLAIEYGVTASSSVILH